MNKSQKLNWNVATGDKTEPRNTILFSRLKEKKLLEANEATLAMLCDQFPGLLIMIWRVLLKLQSVGLVLCKPTSKSMQCYVGTANGKVSGH